MASARTLRTSIVCQAIAAELARRITPVVRSDYIPRFQDVDAFIYPVIREDLEVLAHG